MNDKGFGCSSAYSFEDEELNKDLMVSDAYGNGDIDFQTAKALYCAVSNKGEDL